MQIKRFGKLLREYYAESVAINASTLLMATFAFLLSYPYFIWHTKIPSLVLPVVFLLLLSHRKKRYSDIITLVVFIILYFYASIRGPFTIWGSITVSLLWIIFIADKFFLYSSFRIYKTFFAATLIPALLCFIIVVICGVGLPYHDIASFNAIKDGTYRAYPFFVMYEETIGFPMLRFNAYYDEPGLVGTISAILLISDRCNLKHKENIPIFLAGIFSLSLFFYVILGVYIFIFASIRKKIITLIVLIIAFYMLSTNEYLKDSFFVRFALNGDKLAGDTRTSVTYDMWFKNFILTPTALWGLGGDFASRKNLGGASYKDLIVTYGLVFYVVYVLSFLRYFYSCNKQFLCFLVSVFTFGCVIYQRPSVTDFFYVFLFCGLACTLSYKSAKKYKDGK